MSNSDFLKMLKSSIYGKYTGGSCKEGVLTMTDNTVVSRDITEAYPSVDTDSIISFDFPPEVWDAVLSEHNKRKQQPLRRLLLDVCLEPGDYLRELVREHRTLVTAMEMRESSFTSPSNMCEQFYQTLLKKRFVVGTLQDAIEHYEMLINEELDRLTTDL